MSSLPSPIPSFAEPLRAHVRAAAPDRPGIYRFLGPRGEVLYIGKSVRLRTRLLSYFRARKGKALELLRVARGVEWEELPNEFEALLREMRLIRSFRPPYNVHHRRSRRFAWVKVTSEPAPRLLATRRPIPDGSRYLGPFPASRSLPSVLRELALTLGLRDCSAATPMNFSDQTELLPLSRTPLCSRAEMGSCPAPCAGRISRGAYLERVREAVHFLRGESQEPLQRLQARMERAVEHHGFEVAARLRDRRECLARLQDCIREAEREREELSFLYRVAGEAAPPHLYLLREGRVRMSMPEPAPGDREGRERLEAATARALSTPSTPAHALGEGEREELFLVIRWFRARPEERERTRPVAHPAGS